MLFLYDAFVSVFQGSGAAPLDQLCERATMALHLQCSSITQAAHHQRTGGKPADRIFCCTSLNPCFLARRFNIHLGKLKLFSKYRILKLALCKLASFYCGFLPYSFHLVLEFPQHEFTAYFNVSNT